MMHCHLLCTKDSHAPILLDHGKPVVVGRSPETLITAKNVSRSQVELTADCVNKTVLVKQLGANPCSVGDQCLQKGSTAKLREGTVLCILADHFPHEVKFQDGKVENTSKASKSHEKKSINEYFSNSHLSKGHKRPSDDGNEGSSKKLKVDSKEKCESEGSGDSDDEHSKMVAERLKMLQKNAKKHVASVSSENGATEKIPAEATDERRGAECADSRWEKHDSLLLHYGRGLRAGPKIAAFDIDSTIICTASGKKFPTHSGDWTIMLSEIPGKLKKLHQDGFKICFFTNQMGIHRGKVKVDEYKEKVQNIIRKLGVPVQVFVASGPGPFRKPGLGIWNFLREQANDGIRVSQSKSFYVGDAAGRPDKWAPGKKKDFACSDRLFAMNAGLSFHTPEEFFLSHKKAPYSLPEFDPRKLPSTGPLLPSGSTLVSDHKEVVVCVGFPASGKSRFVKAQLVSKGYVHVNRDTLGSWQKCVAMCQRSLDAGKKVVIDNTNPDQESRKRYLDVAKKAGVPCRCFHFPASLQHCRHNERFREMTDTSHQHINDMIFNSFKSKFQEPKVSEGFSELVKVNFVVDIKDPEKERLYRMFLMEK